MKRISLISSVLFLISSLCHSDEPTISVESQPIQSFQFLYDKHFSPIAGGKNLLTLHQGLERLEDYNPLKEKPQFMAMVARGAELVLGWTPVNYMAMVVQHEVFGHGYRVRALGSSVATVTKYEFNTPPPFGPGGAGTHYTFKKDASPAQLTALAAGGVEATGILAHQIRMDWMKRGMVPAQEAALYAFTSTDLPHYINTLSKHYSVGDVIEGHDISNYLHSLHLNYPQEKPSLSELKRMAKIQYLDPFTYFATLSWFKYLFTGCEASLPSFKFGEISFLPSPRLTLSPFGPEYTFDNYFKYKETPAHIYLKSGKHAGNSYWGIGFLSESLISYKDHIFGVRLDVWQQPKILNSEEWEAAFTGYVHHLLPELFTPEELANTPSTKPFTSTAWGGSGSLIYNYALFPERLAIHVELGYKSSGYLAGESLSGGLLARLALNAHF